MPLFRYGYRGPAEFLPILFRLGCVCVFTNEIFHRSNLNGNELEALLLISQEDHPYYNERPYEERTDRSLEEIDRKGRIRVFIALTYRDFQALERASNQEQQEQDSNIKEEEEYLNLM